MLVIVTRLLRKARPQSQNYSVFGGGEIFRAGTTWPRWHVVQFIAGFASLRFLIFLSRSPLIFAIIAAISRAVCFCVLSSASHLSGVWQCVHVTPRERAK